MRELPAPSSSEKKKTAGHRQAIAVRLIFLAFVMLLLLPFPRTSQALPPPSQEDVDNARHLLSELLQQGDFANFLAGVLNITISPDISAANYTIQDDEGPDTELNTFKIPLGTSFDLPGPGWELVLSGNLGYLQSHDKLHAIMDDYKLDTHFDVNWKAYTFQGGVGVKMPLSKAIYLYPNISAAYSRLESKSHYPNQRSKDLLDPLFRGLLTDFRVHSMTYAAALGIGYEETLGQVDVLLRSMFTYAYTDSFDETNPVQDINEDTETIVVRLETRGPLGLSLWGHSLRWLGQAGYTTFLGPNRDTLGFTYIGELGAGIDLDISEAGVFLDHIGLKGSFLFGDNMTGWQIGLTYDF